MAVERETLAAALNAARQGINEAQERGRDIAERRARGIEPLEERRDERSKEVEPRSRDMIQDIVELSRTRHQVRANATVFRTGANVSEEVVNLGRRIDVRA